MRLRSNGAVYRLPPGPRLPAAAQTYQLMRDPVRFLEDCQERYGQAVTIRLLGFGRTVWVIDPEAVRTMHANPEDLPGGPAANIIEEIVGPNSPTQVDGEPHQRLRRLLSPAFHKESIAHHIEAFGRATENEIATWAPGQTLALKPAMERITLDVILRAVLGLDDRERRERMADAVDRVRSQALLASLGTWVRRDLGRFSPWGRFLRHKQELDRLIYEEIDARQGSANGGYDMLSMLLRAQDSQGDYLSRDELRDQVKALIMGGHETGATALTWAVGLLLHHPAELEWVLAEARDGGYSYTEAAFREAMRLRPPILALGRITQRPVEIGGWKLPPGIRVWAPASLIHRQPEVYEDPDSFRPERLLASAPEHGAWLPFGGGPHRCIGAGFARIETRIILQTMLGQTRLRPAAESLEPVRGEGIIAAPANGMQVVYEGPRTGLRASQRPLATPAEAPAPGEQLAA